MYVYINCDVHVPIYELTELPPNVPILGCFPYGRLYLSTDEGSSLIGHNGWDWFNATRHTSLKLSSSLINCDFSKDKFIPLSEQDKIRILYSITDYISYCNSEESRQGMITACTMIGIRHEELGNLDREVCAPFHLLLENVEIKTKSYIVKTLKYYGYCRTALHKRLQ